MTGIRSKEHRLFEALFSDVIYLLGGVAILESGGLRPDPQLWMLRRGDVEACRALKTAV